MTVTSGECAAAGGDRRPAPSVDAVTRLTRRTERTGWTGSTGRVSWKRASESFLASSRAHPECAERKRIRAKMALGVHADANLHLMVARGFLDRSRKCPRRVTAHPAAEHHNTPPASERGVVTAGCPPGSSTRGRSMQPEDWNAPQPVWSGARRSKSISGRRPAPRYAEEVPLGAAARAQDGSLSCGCQAPCTTGIVACLGWLGWAGRAGGLTGQQVVIV